MAKLNSPFSYEQLHNKRRSMRRTAPPAGGSRIPVYGNSDSARHRSAPHPSRLEQMQAKYREKIMQDKEEKMIGMFERQQEQALRKVAGYAHASPQGQRKGIVRDFFRERRELVESKAELESLPSAESHFQRLKSEKGPIQTYQRGKESQMQRGYTQKQLPQPRAGISRSKPLPALSRHTSKNSNLYNPPTPDGHFETSEEIMEDAEYDRSERSPAVRQQRTKLDSSAKRPSPFMKRNSSQSVASANKPNQLPQMPSRGSAQVTPKQSAAKFSRQKQTVPPAAATGNQREKGKEKLSDFQKWQMEQDQKRDNRLQQYEDKLRAERQEKGYTGSFDSEDNWNSEERTYKAELAAAHDRRREEYNDIQRKERELEELIAKRKADLNRYQSSDSDDDDLFSHSKKGSNTRKLSFDKRNKKQVVPKSKHVDINYNQISRNSLKETYSDDDDDDENMDTYKRGFVERSTYSLQKDQSPVNQSSIMDYNKIQNSKPKPRQTKPVITKSTLKPSKGSGNKIDSYVSPLDNYYRETTDVSFYERAAEDASKNNVQLSLRPCPVCGRKFSEDRLAKHAKVCKQTSTKKRKVYDMTQKRTEGTEAAQYIRRGLHKKETKQVRKGDWRQKHEEFQQTVREARKTQAYLAKGGNLADLPPPPPSLNPDYKQCPYCKRRFSPTAAERHIPKCQNTKSRPAPPKRK